MFSKIAVFASLLIAANALTLRVKAPEVEYCLDGSDAWFSNIVLNILPWPVEISAGAQLSIDGGLDILQVVEVGSQLKLELKLQTPLGELPIPCIPIDGLQIGSCTYPV